MKKVVIIGGGFAGINMALSLSGNSNVQVTLIDKNNYNYFSPLLYQVATGMLNVSSITIPFRTIFKGKKNLRFRLGELQEISRESKTVKLDNGIVSYDFLVIATGTTSNFFGNQKIKRNSLPMKTIADAIELRNTLLNAAELATITDDETEKESLRNIVIAGGGPAGVEIAGMLSELRDYALNKIYPEIDKNKMKLYLIEGGNALLSSMSKKSRDYANACMIKLDVTVRYGVRVTDYTDNQVHLSDGSRIKTKTLIWTAGVEAYKFNGLKDTAYKKGNRILVDPFNKVIGTDNVYAIGDACLQTSKDFPEGYPQLGSVATQQGKQLAKNIIKTIAGRDRRPFEYQDKGTMAIIGKNKATADMEVPKKTLTGWWAWAAWLVVHLFLLINYRNRVKTIWEWTTSYFTTTEPDGLLIGKAKFSSRNSE